MRRWVFPPAAVSRQNSTEENFSVSSVLGRLQRLREYRADVAAELRLRQQPLTETSGRK